MTPNPPALERRLGAWDGTLITIGSIVGTGIFLTTGDIARVLPSSSLLLLVWLVGGLLTLAGALTYAELGAMFPRAGGIYHFLKEAYGPLWGFLYGWTSFWVIMSGGIAAIAAGFGESLGSFLPVFENSRVFWSVSVGHIAWSVHGGQIAAALAILILTAINHFGLGPGAVVQNVLTIVKTLALAAFVVFGCFAVTRSGTALFSDPSPLPAGKALLAAFGVGMIAALWTYDGWYGLTFSAGEMRRPGRDLPIAIIGGTAAVVALYVLINVVYLRALPMGTLAKTTRVGEEAASALFGTFGGNLVSFAILVTIFGCLASTLLYSSRIYLPMAEDGVFFQAAARIHPRFHTPVGSLWLQSLWAIALTLSGTFEQLYTFVVFAGILFHVAAALALFVLRRQRPGAERPYRVWGYPVVPLLFLAACLVLLANTLQEKPRESLAGLGLVALGVPAYALWRRKPASPA